MAMGLYAISAVHLSDDHFDPQKGSKLPTQELHLPSMCLWLSAPNWTLNNMPSLPPSSKPGPFMTSQPCGRSLVAVVIVATPGISSCIVLDQRSRKSKIRLALSWQNRLKVFENLARPSVQPHVDNLSTRKTPGGWAGFVRDVH